MARPNLLHRIGDWVDQGRRFVERGIWETDYSDHRGLVWFVVRQLQVLLLVIKGMREDKVWIRASSLSLITLLSIVPFLAVVFSIFQAVGGLDELRERAHSFIFENIAVGAESEFVVWVDRLISNIHGGAVGGLGTAVLLWAAIRLMAAMEASFNGLWGVRRARPVLMRLVIYWCLLTIGPILLAASLATTAKLQGWLGASAALLGVGHVLKLLPGTLSVLGLALLYMVVPNTRVKLRHALVGGLVAGILFELAKSAYGWVAANLFAYNALYGSLDAVPVFIIWVNICWVIVLFGCEITFANQNVSTLRHEERAAEASPRFRERLAVRLVLDVCIAFYRGTPPPAAAELSHRLGVPVRLVRELLDDLSRAEIVREAAATQQDPGWVPARVLESLTVASVLRAIRERPGEELALVEDAETTYLEGVAEAAEGAAAAVYGQETYLSLSQRFAAESGPPAAEVHSLRPGEPA